MPLQTTFHVTAVGYSEPCNVLTPVSGTGVLTWAGGVTWTGSVTFGIYTLNLVLLCNGTGFSLNYTGCAIGAAPPPFVSTCDPFDVRYEADPSGSQGPCGCATVHLYITL